MSAELIKAVNGKLSDFKVKKIASVLKNGGIIAYPTETVYGLGCDAMNRDAVLRIRGIKGRGDDSPFLVLIPDKDFLNRTVKYISGAVRILIDEFWPGPLTLIVHSESVFPRELTGSSTGLGVRISSDKVAMQIVKGFSGPIVSTSANRSGYLPGVTGEEVYKLFCGEIDIIVDTGSCTGNEPSTVVDTRVTPPKIVRQGIVTQQEIEKIVGQFNSGTN